MKFVSILVVAFLLINGGNCRSVQYFARLGEAVYFDFGATAKELTLYRINNDLEEEHLYASDFQNGPWTGDFKSKLNSNAKLTKDGLLVIDPVTENDFGEYIGDAILHPKFGKASLTVLLRDD
uniref:Esterase-like activity of phytase family protein n=1 Tax=Rhabditophanes sp. KR3021 TaxID=114890 RepID=A0AC35UFT8_9BILA